MRLISYTINNLTIPLLLIDACLEHVGPENITVTEGETDILIPCSVSGSIPPIWEINGSLYEYYQLSEVFQPIYRGLVIKLIQRNLNGVSFRCFTPTGAIGYIVEESSIGYLTVVARGKLKYLKFTMLGKLIVQ